MIRVLIVDDSMVLREYLRGLFEEAGMEVVGVARHGQEAVEQVPVLRPDVVTMDISMPVMDGVEATRRIMRTHPVPIVVVSAQHDREQVRKAFLAVDEGALAVVQKPYGAGHPEHEASVRRLIEKVRLMAGVKVVRRFARPEPLAPPPATAIATERATGPVPEASRAPKRIAGAGQAGRVEAVRVVAIGASTGGPQAIQTILRGLPAVLPVPVLVTQHITPGFTEGFAGWLQNTTGFPVRLARNGEVLRAGQVYLAPDDTHLGVGPGDTVVLSQAPPLYGVRPAVAFLFRTVAEQYGAAAIGVILTGMGQDGAAELKLIKDRGGLTVGQDEATCVVYGMPAAAQRLGALVQVLPLDEIGPFLRRYLHTTLRSPAGAGRLGSSKQ
ncbi:MAG: chemotaxis-specific protein-glutamate methyltransferase CheB [Bacteroidetes bacterium]|nr:MAG: chemotaxis-specific protein-glutamate methyltransferase CheB [Bacteroidota bacterium]